MQKAQQSQLRLNAPPSSAEIKEMAALKAELEMELKNKKQCIYQPYQCTQLSLDGYKYCLRHILQDKTAPFRQCSYVYTSNGKRCQLAAPKIEKRDYAYCSEHAVRATLTKNRENSRCPPPQSAEALLYSLGHYMKRQNGDECDRLDDIDGKTTKSLDPFTDLDANALCNSASSAVLDFCSESDSDVDPSTFASVWCDAQNDSSDNESIDSEQEDALKHANVYTAEEISSITKDKLVKLQSLYIEQYRHLQHVLKEKRRKYIHSMRREKETCCNIFSQIKENPKEQRLYKKLKALNNYQKVHGNEAILNKRLHDSRTKLTDRGYAKPLNYTKCTFSEGGVKCGERTLPLARHCRRHITEDPNQVLFRRCGKVVSDIECPTPIEAIFEDQSCPLHTEIPPIKSYAQMRKSSESDFEDTFEAPETALMESQSVKTELIDFKLEPEEMKTLPSMLFEESSMEEQESGTRNELDMENDDTQTEEDEKIDVDASSPDDFKLEIDLKDEDSTTTNMETNTNQP